VDVSTNMAFAENYNANLATQAASPPRKSHPADRPASPALVRPASTAPAAAATTRRSALDLRLPCMLYAAIGVPACSGAALESVLAQMRGSPGVLKLIGFDDVAIDGSLACAGGVAVVARGYWLARQGLARLMDLCRDAADPAASRSGAGLPAPAPEALTASSAACTAQMYRGQLRLWMSGADPAAMRAAAARLAEVPPADVDLRALGTHDGPHGLAVLHPAIVLARRLQPAPVQVIVSHDLGLHRCAPRAEGADAVQALAPTVALAA
jgi:hypothetical protein